MYLSWMIFMNFSSNQNESYFVLIGWKFVDIIREMSKMTSLKKGKVSYMISQNSERKLKLVS